VALGCKLYYLARGPNGLYFSEFNTVSSTWRVLAPYSWLTDVQGWDAPMRYETIRLVAAGSRIYVYGQGEVGTCLSAYDPVTDL